jgi:2-C-methyl-D-erythritol 4-phosphate cytidylyltransferase
MSGIVSKITDLVRAVLGKSTSSPKTAAIVLAAGSSTRMDSDIPKQLIEINDIPIMIRSLLAFEGSESISEIVLVAPEEYVSYYRSLARTYKIKKLSAVTAGGTSRNESASAGFKRVSSDAKFVAIHDAARCLVTPEIIDRVCRSAYRYNAATAATRAIDTVKVSGKNKLSIIPKTAREFGLHRLRRYLTQIYTEPHPSLLPNQSSPPPTTTDL